MDIDKEEVEHIAMLARVTIPEGEKGQFSEQLSQILTFVNQLREVDTEGRMDRFRRRYAKGKAKAKPAAKKKAAAARKAILKLEEEAAIQAVVMAEQEVAEGKTVHGNLRDFLDLPAEA